MAEQLDFEAALERRLQARASMATRPFDAAAIASAAVVARPARQLALPWTFRGLAWRWVAVMLATLAIVGGTLLAGALLRDDYTGPWLAYTASDGLYLAHEDGTHPRRIFASANRLSLSGWSADGSLIAVVVDEVLGDNVSGGRTLVVDTDGRVVWSREGVSDVVWSHHGHRLAWRAPTALMVADVDTGVTSTWLAWGPDTFAVEPTWSPDDTRIAFIWREGTGPIILRIVAEDGSVRDLPLALLSTGAPLWSPDGRSISVATWDETTCGSADDGSCPSDIVIVDPATGAQVDGIRNLNWVMGRAWSPDGTRLAWDAIDRAGQGNLFVGTLPLSGREPVQVTDWPGSTWLVGWSSDGRSLLAEHRADPENATGAQPVELWRVPVDPADGDPVLLRDDVIWAALQPTP